MKIAWMGGHICTCGGCANWTPGRRGWFFNGLPNVMESKERPVMLLMPDNRIAAEYGYRPMEDRHEEEEMDKSGGPEDAALGSGAEAEETQ